MCSKAKHTMSIPVSETYKMTSEEKSDVRNVIEKDGLDYAIKYYWGSPPTGDKKFHDLWYQYLKIAKEIADYVDYVE